MCGRKRKKGGGVGATGSVWLFCSLFYENWFRRLLFLRRSLVGTQRFSRSLLVTH